MDSHLSLKKFKTKLLTIFVDIDVFTEKKTLEIVSGHKFHEPVNGIYILLILSRSSAYFLTSPT